LEIESCGKRKQTNQTLNTDQTKIAKIAGIAKIDNWKKQKTYLIFTDDWLCTDGTDRKQNRKNRA
jgi:hypothetical protein